MDFLSYGPRNAGVLECDCEKKYRFHELGTMDFNNYTLSLKKNKKNILFLSDCDYIHPIIYERNKLQVTLVC